MSRLEAYGISIDLPGGWEARAFRHAGGEPTVHVGSFPLPRSDGEFGSRATQSMPPDGVFLALTEYRVRADELRSGLFASPPPRALEPQLLGAHTLLRPLDGQRGAQQFFSTAGRGFCLYVVVGARAEKRLPAASRLLTSLRVAEQP